MVLAERTTETCYQIWKTTDDHSVRIHRGAKLTKATVSRLGLSPDGSDGHFRQFIHDFLTFSATVNQIRNGFSYYIGLSGVAYTTLMSIAFLQDKHEIGVNELADHLHLSPAFVTIEVSKLVKAGLVEKRTNKKDRRRVLLTLSINGKSKLEELVTIQVPVNDALFECLTQEEFKELSGYIHRLLSCGDRAVSLLNYLKYEKEPSHPIGITEMTEV